MTTVPTAPPARPSREAQRARAAVAALFWLNGATIASLAPRYPLIRDTLHLSNTFFGLAVAAGPLGGLVAGLFAPRLLRATSSAAVATWAQACQVLVLCLLLNSPTAWAFAAFMVLLSACDVYTDIAMNAHGLRVEGLYGRSINNSFHAWWSLGAVGGGLLASWFAGIGLSLPAHAAVAGTLMLTVNVLLRRHLLQGPDPTVAHDAPAAGTARIPRPLLLRLVALGLVGAFAASIEDAGFTWSSLYLHDVLHASPGTAGLGLVFLVGAQTVGRFTGDRLVDRLGNRGAARLGCAVASAGMALALLLPSVPLTLLGFACAGWGVATVVPGVYHTAHHLPGLPAGAGLSIVNWLLRLTFFVGPPLVGLVSDRVGLRLALLVMPLATMAVLALSSCLAGRERPTSKAAAH